MKRRSGRGRTTRIHPKFDPGRREFLTGVAAATGALALPGCGRSDPVAGPALPDPERSGIDHIIVLMMENRSFDHYLGWLPGADGKQAGLTYKRGDQAFQTFPLGVGAATPEYQGCQYADPDHSHEGGLVEYNNGACDGFLLPRADEFAIGYYGEADLPFTAAAARAWTTYDRYFTSLMAETYPNRFYQHAAQTPMIHNDIQSAFVDPATIPTIWDRLTQAGRTGTYYYRDLPFVGLWGSKYMDDGTAQPYSKFLTDAAAGQLPAVSFVDPLFSADADSGESEDDHPFADIRKGQVFLNQVYQAVINSPQWPRTALFINYDEWGGFFDHVPPPEAGVIPDADRAAFEGEGLPPSSRMGFRVPVLAISPYARRGFVSHAQYDHCSILKMIEWRFGLAPLTARDAVAGNIAESLDFAGGPNLAAPAFAVSTGAFGQTCPGYTPGASAGAAQALREKHAAELRLWRDLARYYGFPVR